MYVCVREKERERKRERESVCVLIRKKVSAKTFHASLFLISDDLVQLFLKYV